MLLDTLLNIDISEVDQECPLWVNLVPVILVVVLILTSIKVSYKARIYRDSNTRSSHREQDDNY